MSGGNPRTPNPPPAGEVQADHASLSPARRTWVKKSAAAIMVEVDPAVSHVLGWDPVDLLGKTSLDFIHADDQALAIENWMQMLGSPGPSPPLRFRHRHRDGCWVWVEMTNDNLLDDPAQACVIADMLDISEEMGSGTQAAASDEWQPGVERESRPLQLHEALRAREQVLHRLAEALPVGVLHVDASGRVLYTNHQLHVIIGTPRATSVADQLDTVVPEDTQRVTEAFEAALRGGLDSDIEIRVATSEARGAKEIRQCALSVRTLVSDDGEVTGAVASLADVTESVRMRDELRLQATFDKLTSCYNRASTMDALHKMLLVAPAGRRPAVVFVDLDDFKAVNDHLGHAAGDQMLEIVARRLQRSVREGDVVGRIGGDEFLILCPGINSDHEALRAATRLSRSLAHDVNLSGAVVSCRASVGVAWSPDPTLDGDTLISYADTAMYEAKRSGLADRVRLFGDRPGGEPLRR